MDKSSSPLILGDEIRAGYKKKTVLDGVSVSVNKGEVVGLIGPNGSGKTTLLKVLCGALSPWNGTAEIAGRRLSGLSASEKARLASYVPQSENHSFDFTVRELTLMGRFSCSDGLFETNADNDAADRAMDAADCLAFAHRRISTLSGGEAQRVLIARALAQETPALFCDEPTTHLDPKHQLDIGSLLRRLGDQGQTVVVTTHDLNLAALCCDRVVMLLDGKVAFDGKLEDGRPSPLEDVFDVGFFGSEGYLWPQRPG